MNNEQTTVAELLKSARVERGLSVKHIASDICVRSNYLTAIEAAKYDTLPGKTFAIGFVKSYATALGLETTAVVEAFKKEYCPKEYCLGVNSFEQTHTVTSTKPSRKAVAWFAPLLGLAGASACWILFSGTITTDFMQPSIDLNTVEVEEAQLAAVQANIIVTQYVEAAVVAESSQTDEMTSEIIEVSSFDENQEVTEPEPSQVQSFFTQAAYADAIPEQQVAGNYTLHAVEDSWVKIAHADGTEVWSGILREGQTYRPQADGVILLSTSNAGGVLLQVNGGEAESLGARGAVVSDLELEDMTLLSNQEVGELSEFGSD